MKAFKFSSLFQWCFVLLISSLLFSCGKENIQPNITGTQPAIAQKALTQGQDAQIPSTAVEQLKISKEVWNSKFADELTFVDFKFVEDIKSDDQKSKLIEQTTSTNALIASGNINDASTMSIRKISAERNVNERKEIMSRYANETINVGDKLVEITWKQGTEFITTQCVVNQKGIQWDNVLTGVLAVEEEEVTDPNPDARIKSRYHGWQWHGNWLWGQKRGTIGYSIKIYYWSRTYVTNSDHNNWVG